MNYEGLVVIFNNVTKEENELKIGGDLLEISDVIRQFEKDKLLTVRYISVWQKRNYNVRKVKK